MRGEEIVYVFPSLELSKRSRHHHSVFQKGKSHGYRILSLFRSKEQFSGIFYMLNKDNIKFQVY
ncbi:hypothetical protein CVN76_11125 [Bacillus sp. mrc49]|nr:hypothetical protein CVN76_11125 [Bacillus sp. mrc49]